MSPVTGVGGYRYIPDIIFPKRILQPEIHYVEVSDNVSAVDGHVVGVDSSRDFGDAPLVQSKGLEVSVADVRVELVKAVACLVGEGEYSLEQEVEVRIIADQATVESLVGESSGGHDIRVLIFQRL